MADDKPSSSPAPSPLFGTVLGDQSPGVTKLPARTSLPGFPPSGVVDIDTDDDSTTRELLRYSALEYDARNGNATLVLDAPTRYSHQQLANFWLVGDGAQPPSETPPADE